MNSLACPAGSSIAIFGGGPVGLAAVMGAVIQGCATTILVEPIAARRDIGQELPATHVIDPPQAGDLAAAPRAIVPAGLDLAFATSVVVPVIASALASLGSHGALGPVALPSEPTPALNIRYATVL